MKKYWLVIFPDTFLWIKGCKGIIYNSKNFKYCSFYCSDTIRELYDKLVDLDNLYSVEITEESLKDKHLKQWVDQIIKIEAGCMIEQNGQNKKMISYYPILSVQNDLDKIIWENEQSIGGKIIDNLNELVFHINGSSYGSDHYYKQTNYPIKTDASLDFTRIKQFISQCNNRILNQITIIGDLVNYADFEQLNKWVNSNELFIRFIVLAEDLEENLALIKLFNSDKLSTSIIVKNDSVFFKQPELYQEFFDHVTFTFTVKSVDQLNSVFTILERLDIKSHDIVPLYDFTNKKFFEENVYLTIEDLDTVEMSKREVFAKMTLNVQSFGKLTILPDGNIYSNVNNIPLGKLGYPIYDLIYKEMIEEKAWFYIRDMEPCSDCVYQWLCPSPGNYERAIGKPNLCHITE